MVVESATIGAAVVVVVVVVVVSVAVTTAVVGPAVVVVVVLAACSPSPSAGERLICSGTGLAVVAEAVSACGCGWKSAIILVSLPLGSISLLSVINCSWALPCV